MKRSILFHLYLHYVRAILESFIITGVYGFTHTQCILQKVEREKVTVVCAHVNVEAVVLDESYEESGGPPFPSHQVEPISQTPPLVRHTRHLGREGGREGRRE